MSWHARPCVKPSWQALAQSLEVRRALGQFSTCSAALLKLNPAPGRIFIHNVDSYIGRALVKELRKAEGFLAESIGRG